MDTHLMERLETAIVEDKENGLYRAGAISSPTRSGSSWR